MQIRTILNILMQTYTRVIACVAACVCVCVGVCVCVCVCVCICVWWGGVERHTQSTRERQRERARALKTVHHHTLSCQSAVN
jgi:hypothetical protein